MESREAGGAASRNLGGGESGTGDPGRAELGGAELGREGGGGPGARRMLRPGGQPCLSAFPGLGWAERRDLSDWSHRIAGSGIDAILDLSARPWRVTGAAAVIGVFETAKPLATWIILHLAGEWLLLRPADGFISPPSATLRDVLGRIEPPGTILDERGGWR